MPFFSPLPMAFSSIVIFLMMAGLALVLQNRQTFLVNMTFFLSTVSCGIGLYAGFEAVASGSLQTMIMPIGLPDLPFYIRVDALSGFFLSLASLTGLMVSIYSFDYVKGILRTRKATKLIVFYCLFMAGMVLVLISDDAYFFMSSWELMALSSFFLVSFEDESAQNRRAAFLYILIAHIGAVMILLSFGILAGFAAGFENFMGYRFSAMRSAEMSTLWASIAFFLAFFGFASKAGVVPLHVWLPEAHPAAPSNISALMSAVMLKIAVYGILRVCMDIIGIQLWWWGGVVLIIGLITAVMGILYALMQVDIKRVLAYSSVEHVGIITVGIGLSMIFTFFKLGALAALALTAALYHCLSHSVFKSLLFMAAGSVLHATGERNMERLGGLIHKLPWTSAMFLVGALSIAAMPLFGGFVSEWLTFQAFLLSPVLPNPLLKLLFPLGAALLALTAALSARCFVKVFAVTFLGQRRAVPTTETHEAGISMRLAMSLAVISSLALGLFPSFVIDWIDTVPQSLVGGRIASSAGAFGWMWLTPISAERASYSAPIVFVGIFAALAVAWLAFHSKKATTRRSAPWDCGFEKMTPRMQYNSTSFAMPLRRIFGFLFIVRESVRRSAPQPGAKARIQYSLRIEDRLWYVFYKPFSDAAYYLAKQANRLQHGRVQIYLLYSFITLITLLVFA